MGLNFAGDAIVDDEVVKRAARMEILRRYMTAKTDLFEGKGDVEQVEKAKQLCDFVGICEADRKVIKAAREKANKTDTVSAAMQLDNGKVICGKTISDLTCASSVVLNALKTMAEIADGDKLIPKSTVEPVVRLKTEVLGSVNPRLCLEDCLVAMFAHEKEDERIARALKMLPRLAGTELHSSAILSQRDRVVLKKLRVNITADAVYDD